MLSVTSTIRLQHLKKVQTITDAFQFLTFILPNNRLTINIPSYFLSRNEPNNVGLASRLLTLNPKVRRPILLHYRNTPVYRNIPKYPIIFIDVIKINFITVRTDKMRTIFILAVSVLWSVVRINRPTNWS